MPFSRNCSIEYIVSCLVRCSMEWKFHSLFMRSTSVFSGYKIPPHTKYHQFCNQSLLFFYISPSPTRLHTPLAFKSRQCKTLVQITGRSNVWYFQVWPHFTLSLSLPYVKFRIRIQQIPLHKTEESTSFPTNQSNPMYFWILYSVQCSKRLGYVYKRNFIYTAAINTV